MSRFVVIYHGKPHIVEAEDFEHAENQFWSSEYPEGITAITRLPEEEESSGEG